MVEGSPERAFSPFFFLRYRSLQGDCDGSSKQAHGGPQPARLAAVFWLGERNWFGHLGASLDQDLASVDFRHELAQRRSKGSLSSTADAILALLKVTLLLGCWYSSVT